jgi:hypothetical protein
MGSRRLLAALAAALSFAVCAGTAQAGLVHFRSPSGNIDCLLGSGNGTPNFADCLVKTHAWPHHPAKPSRCDLDFDPYEIGLSGTQVYVGSCRGDIGPLCGPGTDRCTVLAYGHSVTQGGIRCTSAPSGVTCRRLSGRHVGFRIAREGYAVWR